MCVTWSVLSTAPAQVRKGTTIKAWHYCVERVGRDECEASPLCEFVGKSWEVQFTAVAFLGQAWKENVSLWNVHHSELWKK